MKIEKIISQHRRDFIAKYVCEHCGYNYEDAGYDDENFHDVVIPNMKCKKCNKKADENYRPLNPNKQKSQLSLVVGMNAVILD